MRGKTSMGLRSQSLTPKEVGLFCYVLSTPNAPSRGKVLLRTSRTGKFSAWRENSAVVLDAVITFEHTTGTRSLLRLLHSRGYKRPSRRKPHAIPFENMSLFLRLAFLTLIVEPLKAENPFLLPYKLIQSAFETDTTPDEWSYEQPEEWPETCRTGQRQSPINIVEKDAIRLPIPALRFNYSYTGRVLIATNGHTGGQNAVEVE